MCEWLTKIHRVDDDAKQTIAKTWTQRIEPAVRSKETERKLRSLNRRTCPPRRFGQNNVRWIALRVHRSACHYLLVCTVYVPVCAWAWYTRVARHRLNVLSRFVRVSFLSIWPNNAEIGAHRYFTVVSVAFCRHTHLFKILCDWLNRSWKSSSPLRPQLMDSAKFLMERFEKNLISNCTHFYHFTEISIAR